MRSAYCRAQARWLRWKEEIQLLLEEMSRVTLFLLWKAKWWDAHALSRPNIDSALESGCVAYAHRQQWVFRSLAQKFHAKWVPFLASHSLTVDWSPELSLSEVDPSNQRTRATSSPPVTDTSSTLPQLISMPSLFSAIMENELEEDAEEMDDENEDDEDGEDGEGSEGGEGGENLGSDEDGYDSAY